MTGMGKTERNISTGGRKIQIQDTGDKFGNAFELGHESYRDGVVSDINSQKEETFNAVVGHAKMAARMSGYGIFFGGDYGLEALAYMKGDMDTLREIAEEYYSSEEDSFYTKQEYIGWYQNSGKGNKGYDITPLGNAPTKERTEQINLARQKEKYNLFLTDSLNKYNEDNNTTLTMEDFEKTDSFTTLEDFKTLIDNDRKKENGEKQYELYYHNELNYIGLNENGCALACAAYNVYSLTGQFYSLAKTNEIAKELGLFYEGSGMLNNMTDGYAKLLNKMIGDDVIEFVENSLDEDESNEYLKSEVYKNKKVNILEKYSKSLEEYLCLLKTYTDIGFHFVNLDDLNYQEKLNKEEIKEQYIENVSVNNPWYTTNPKSQLGKQNYSIDDINRITIFKINSEKIKRNIPKKELYEQRRKFYEKKY